MSKFKAGDKVEILIACSGNVVGEIHVLTNRSTGGLHGSGLWAGLCDCCKETHWKLISRRGRPPKPKQVKYYVIYDKTCGDPCKAFYTRKELNEWLKEALEDREIIWDSIKILSDFKEQVVTVKFKLEEKK